ncbi:MAG: hypothetical protein ACKPKO_14410, partial [Candidatus Fonsibacter sp.]
MVNATRQAIRQFCTKKWAMPAGGRGKAVHDKALQRHIQDQVGGERLNISDGFLAPATANVGGHHLVGSTVRDHYFDMVLD